MAQLRHRPSHVPAVSPRRVRRDAPGELIGLSWDDVDLDNAQVTVHWQITLVSYAKARKAIRQGGRTIDLGSQTVEDDPHRVYKAFVASVARLGLKPQPLHMLRHLTASLLIAKAAARLVPRGKSKPKNDKPKKGKRMAENDAVS